MFITILIIAVRSIICITFGIVIGDRLSTQYRPQLYTLVIETYDANTDESTYDVRKFISQSERISFYDNYFETFIGLGREQQWSRLHDNNEVYKVLHEID